MVLKSQKEVMVMALCQTKIVTIGCGTGQSNLVRVLSQNFSNLTAIVSVTDNGGHSGLLRQQLDIPQVGDGRQVLEALATNQVMAELFSHRFSSTNDGELHGVSLGNFILASLCQKEGDIAKAFIAAAKLLNCQGQVFPATTANVNVGAILSDGSRIIGEWEIIERQPRLPIKEIFLAPAAPAYIPALEAVGEADWVIVGPGSLLTGLIPIFLADGMVRALRYSKAMFIYISNLMTQPGQTDDFTTAKDHLLRLSHCIGRIPNVVIANNGSIPSEILKSYQEIGSQPVDSQELKRQYLEQIVIKRDLVPDHYDRPTQERFGRFKKWTHLLVHDSKKLLAAIGEVIGMER